MPSASTVTSRRCRSPARSLRAGCRRGRALVAGADAMDAAVGDEQLLRVGLRRTAAPPASACSARKRPAETETIQLPWLRIVGGGGIRRPCPSSAGRPPRRGPRRSSARPPSSAGRGRGDERARVHDGAGEEVRPGLPFSTTATGTSPSRAAVSGDSSSSCPSRIAQARPAGPAPTMRTPTSIRSSTGSVGGAIRRRERWRVVGRPDAVHAPCAADAR